MKIFVKGRESSSATLSVAADSFTTSLAVYAG